MDQIQRLHASRSMFADYPCNLIQTDQFQYDLEQYRDKLGDESGGYFNPRNKRISVWCLPDGKNGEC